MNVRQRRELFAGAGLMSMLCGALMVVAPVAGAHDADHHLNDPSLWGVHFDGVELDAAGDSVFTYTIVRTPESLTDADNRLSNLSAVGFCVPPIAVEPAFDEPTQSKWENGSVPSLESGEKFQFTFEGDYIDAVDDSGSRWVLKKGNEDIPEHGVAGGAMTVSSAGPDCDAAQHGSFTLDKEVAGDLQPTDDPTYSFSVECFDGETPIDLNGDGAGNAAAVDLKDEDPAWSSETALDVDLEVGATCVVLEVEDNGAPSVSYAVDGAAVPKNGDGSIDVVIGDEVKVVVATNDFGNQTEEVGGGGVTPSYSVDIDKLGDSDDADSDFSDFEVASAPNTDVDFELTIENTGTGALVIGVLEDAYGGDEGEVVVDLLERPDISCVRGGMTVDLSSPLPGRSTTVCTFTIEGYAPDAGTSLRNVITLDTNRTLPVTDDATVVTPFVQQEATGTVTLVKEVRGDTDPDGWSFQFNGGSLGVITVTDDDNSEGPLPVAAGTYTVAEDFDALARGWAFRSADCVDAEGADVVSADGDGAVTFAVAPAADVTCTFVNVYTAAAILPTPTSAPELPAPTVRGDVVSRPHTLPRTGSEAAGLAAAGAGLLAVGAAMVLGGRMRFRRVE